MTNPGDFAVTRVGENSEGLIAGGQASPLKGGCPNPAPAGMTAVFIVGFCDVWCGYCGRRTRPDTAMHKTVLYACLPGCGATFNRITCDQPVLTDDWRAALAAMRRDLPAVPPAEAREMLGHDAEWLLQ